MKKILYLFAAVVLFSSCDDGEIVIENLNFANSKITSCVNTPTGLLFKTNGQELLLIDVPATLFDTVVSNAADPKIYTLQPNQQEIIYRKYNGAVSSTTICSLVPPATPNVADQWIGQPGGTIEVITSEVTNTNATTGEVTRTGFSYVIRFKNVQLKNEQSSFVYEDYYFGEYIVNTTTP